MTTLIGENVDWSKRARGNTRERFSPSRALGGVWALQRDRWILWLPVGMIAGAAVWLLAPVEPSWWAGPLITMVALFPAVALSLWPSGPLNGVVAGLRTLAVAACALAAAAGLGFSAGQIRGLTVAQPAYVGSEEAVRVEGWVVANDASDNGPRLRILVRGIEGVEATPRYVSR